MFVARGPREGGRYEAHEAQRAKAYWKSPWSTVSERKEVDQTWTRVLGGAIALAFEQRRGALVTLSSECCPVRVPVGGA